MYQYNATIIKVVDGDTMHVSVDLGMDIANKTTLRIAHINAPEVSTPEGITAKSIASSLLPVGTVVVINTIKDKREKYGRYLATITLPSGDDFGTFMLDNHLAVPYEG